MMRLLILAVLLFLGASGVYSKDSKFLIDDFEDMNLTFNPEWFQFGDGIFNIQSTQKIVKIDLKGRFLSFIKGFLDKPVSQDPPYSSQKTSLCVTGGGTHWYVGGLGTYLAIDVRPLTHLGAYIKGDRRYPCRIKIEILEDDNNNWQIEQDIDHDFKPLFDDKFVYELNVNWDGWKRVQIPFLSFRDSNPGVGDDKWNPYQRKNSGGLIQLQLVFLTPQSSPNAKIYAEIDSLYFYKIK